ncbi:MAG TPA: aminoglycoside adenylyltransferase domain-containing protein [Ktedonobacteraceae bacterium]|nr:aminoglycoside adenylyltransferase domain-containing protein [Ktedonobacteraceae bacterium]
METFIPTPIQPLIDAYLDALEPLRSHFYGIYIFGSIALGAFEVLTSDIDIIALTQGEWTPPELAQLKAVHTQLMRTHQLGKRLDALYVPLHNLGKCNGEVAPYPNFHRRKFFAGYGDLNYITWWIVKNRGICLLGPERSILPFEVTRQDVLKTMRYNLDVYWANKAKRPYLFLLDGWIVLAVAILCSMLSTIEDEKIITKAVALKRGRDRLPARWHTLIDEAWRIRYHLSAPSLYRSRLKRMRETLAFIEYVRERAGKVLEVSSGSLATSTLLN